MGVGYAMILPYHFDRERVSMKKLNCFRCKHFRTTWNPAFPRACNAYGFKTKEMPSALVLKSTGTECLQFAEKNHEKPKKRTVTPNNIDYRL
ncbi:hypothetical protein SAMN04487936_1222 [Halobacillus dabanensis]|uniref:Uracil-DNA glycosylase n=1 Tax=Halobacillus dabanensis TaxID=240302 RepID=A0A1I4AVE4_HALDA|nr:hypothetical protein SAMN04487936_1222 [Halobacillus dabanensis]